MPVQAEWKEVSQRPHSVTADRPPMQLEAARADLHMRRVV